MSVSRLPVMFLALLAATACVQDPDVSKANGTFGFLRGAPEKVVVAGKSVVIAGPPGYCVNSSATRNSESGAFVLLGSCASIANSARATAPQSPGLLTASISGASGATIGDSLDRLEAFFRSDSGRAALARDGTTDSVRILRAHQQDDAFYIHARDTSAGGVNGISQDYWRGLFDINGRIVTVSVVGFKARPMSDENGLSTLDAFAARIRAENPIDKVDIAREISDDLSVGIPTP